MPTTSSARRRAPLVAVLAILALTSPARAADAPARAAAPKAAAAARIERKTYPFKDAAASKDIEYALFVPTTYDKARKSPLVVALHGLNSNPQQIMHYPGLADQAEKLGWIVVAPMGYNTHGWYGARALVKGKPDDPANLAELSERDVMNVLDIVRKDYAIDPDRIYLMGHSMGGGGTWHLGIKYPDLWAALAPIAPAPVRLPADAEKIKHLPVILIQGAKDMLVRVEWVRPWAEQMKKLGMTYEYIEVPTGDHLSVAFTNMPKIFEFFDKHKRGETAKSNPAK